MDSNQTAGICRRSVNINAISQKVEKDIAFLSDRIKLMRESNNPNRVVLQTYESMLASRLSVLDCLKGNPHYQPSRTSTLPAEAADDDSQSRATAHSYNL